MRLDRETGLKSVKVDRLKLIFKLKKNRDVHMAEFDEAWEGYVRAVVQKAQDILVRAKGWAKDAKKPLSFDSSPTPPESHVKDYNRAIALLEWEIKPEVELSINDFNCYVLDDWGWKRDFNVSKMSYSR